jgi:hypothetical protein
MCNSSLLLIDGDHWQLGYSTNYVTGITLNLCCVETSIMSKSFLVFILLVASPSLFRVATNNSTKNHRDVQHTTILSLFHFCPYPHGTPALVRIFMLILVTYQNTTSIIKWLFPQAVKSPLIVAGREPVYNCRYHHTQRDRSWSSLASSDSGRATSRTEFVDKSRI